MARRVDEGPRLEQRRGSLRCHGGDWRPSWPASRSDKAKEINKFIKNQGLKGVQSRTRGEQIE